MRSTGSTAAWALLLLAAGVRSLDNGLALTPPRGWRSWNLFGLDVTQTLLEEIMDAMVARTRTVDGVPTSFFDLGYSDVGLDDGWQLPGSGPGGKGYHSANGTPVVNTTRFPDLAAMAAHGHSLNLTVGWYGNNCWQAEQNSSVAHFEGDVAAFRSFGFVRFMRAGCACARASARARCLASHPSHAPPLAGLVQAGQLRRREGHAAVGDAARGQRAARRRGELQEHALVPRAALQTDGVRARAARRGRTVRRMRASSSHSRSSPARAGLSGARSTSTASL